MTLTSERSLFTIILWWLIASCSFCICLFWFWSKAGKQSKRRGTLITVIVIGVWSVKPAHIIGVWSVRSAHIICVWRVKPTHTIGVWSVRPTHITGVWSVRPAHILGHIIWDGMPSLLPHPPFQCRWFPEYSEHYLAPIFIRLGWARAILAKQKMMTVFLICGKMYLCGFMFLKVCC